MAFYFTNSFLFAFVLLPLSLTSIPTFADPNGSLIGDICPRTTNPPLCLKALKSDPRSAHADLHGLCEISIELLQSSANEAIKMIDLLNKNTTVPLMRSLHDMCSEYYYSTFAVFDDAKDFLKVGNYSAITSFASNVPRLALFCELSVEPQSAAKIIEADKNLSDLSSIIEIIGKILAGQ